MFYRKNLMLLIGISILLVSCVPKEDQSVKTDIHFFYLELCPGCEEYEEAERMAGMVSDLGGFASNIIHDDDAAAMKSLLEERGLMDIAHVLPLLVQGTSYIAGYEEIAMELERLTEGK